LKLKLKFVRQNDRICQAKKRTLRFLNSFLRNSFLIRFFALASYMTI